MSDKAVTFLLVDDLEDNLLALEGLLRRDGLQLLKAHSAREALELLLIHDVALAMLDVQMPEMDGFGLAELMRGTERTRRVPIIFVTAGIQDNYRRFRGYELGAVDFLYKPIDPHVLKSKADVFFELARQRNELEIATQALQESEERFRALAENIPQLAWMTDVSGGIAWFNRRWFEFTGTTFTQMEGGGWQQVHHPEHAERVIAGWNRALETGELWEDTFPLRSKEGQYRWFLSRAVPILDAAGKVIRWFGTNTDITELREVQRLLNEQLNFSKTLTENLEITVAERTATLRETVAELEHFSYTITHDMRSPLRSMHGFAQILSDEHAPNLDDTGREYLRRIMQAAMRMDRLIIDALNYSKSVRTELTLEPIDPGPLLRGIIESYPQFQPPGAAIDIAEKFPTVCANEAGLTQCFSNLLTNAVKFVAPGTRPEVKVWGEQRNGRVRLWFEDNGIGIPPDQQERVFMMFQRLDNTYEGTGVGLALVRKVVQQMKGTVGFESNPGKGTRFWVDLSAAPRDDGVT